MTLVVGLLMTLLGLTAGTAAGASADDASSPDRPPPTVSDFYPEDANLSDCIGLVEKPGCGSEARGGWGQAAIFGALAVGLGLIFWRVAVGVRRNRERTEVTT